MSYDTEKTIIPLFADHRASISKISDVFIQITGRNVHQQGYLGFMEQQCEQNAAEMFGRGKGEGKKGREKKLGESNNVRDLSSFWKS